MEECLSLLFELLVHQSEAQIIRFKTDLRDHIHIVFCSLFSGWDKKVNCEYGHLCTALKVIWIERLSLFCVL